MKKLFGLLLFCSMFVLPRIAQAQLDCTDSLTYVQNSAVFTTFPFSMGDSSVNFSVVNSSGTFYVYPQGRVVPITPLPAGTSLSQPWGWHVFQSAWNPGDTGYVSTPFLVTQPIPANYTVDFEIWINYNEPLQDSCKFPFTVTLNLNPQTATGLSDFTPARPKKVYPNPSHDQFQIAGLENFTRIELRDLQGRLVREYGPRTKVFELPEQAVGRYFVVVFGKEGTEVLPLLAD